MITPTATAEWGSKVPSRDHPTVATSPDSPCWTFDDFPDILTSRQCMQVLGISEGTFYELCKSGFLRNIAVRVGRQLRFSKAALRQALEGPRADS